MNLTTINIPGMERRARAAFVNSLSGFKSANLIGTSDGEGATNLAIMSSLTHLGSHPPLFSLVIRPGGDERHTLRNILDTGVFSVNHVTAEMVEQAHQTAARYAPEESEFDATGLCPVWLDNFGAPMVREANVRLGLKLRQHMKLAINDTHLVIGEVVLACVPEQACRADSSLDLGAAGSVALSGLDTYHTGGEQKRMAYAKPGLPPREID